MKFIEKWNTYQKERFPIIVYGLYIFCIVFAVFCYSSYIEAIHTNAGTCFLIEGCEPYKIQWYKLIPMFIFAFLQYLMVRIVDEFKDYEEDLKYRPYRPVPRGLVSLKELKILFILCVIIQLIIAFAFNKNNILILIGLWGFFAVFCKDFFIKKFLDKHILLTVFIDEFLIAMLAWYLSSFVYSINFSEIWIMLLMTYIVSWIVEVARKVRAKEDEEEGVKTYTAVLGIGKSVYILFILETLLMYLQLLTLGKTHIPWIIAVFIIVQIINMLFIEKKNKKFARLTEFAANAYIIIVYLSMGLLII